MKVREVTNYMVRRYSGNDLWNYMFESQELYKIKTSEGEDDYPSYQIIDEILDEDEKYVEIRQEVGPGWFFTNKARLLKPHQWYWAHPSFASKSSLGIVPNGYNTKSPNPYTISKGLKLHFGIETKEEILNIRIGLMDMYERKDEFDIIRKTNPYT